MLNSAPNLHSKRSTQGFTLLELLIAISILAFALSALLGHQGVAIQASEYSNRVSQAAFLLEAKVQDVKHKMISDSIDVYDNCEEGDFRDEGFNKKMAEYRWKVCAFKIEIQEGSTELLTERFMSIMSGGMGGDAGLGGAGGVGGLGALGGGGMGANGSGMNPMDQAMGQIAMATGMIPQFLQQLEEQIRKVRLEVSWQNQRQRRRIVIERFVTTLGMSKGPTEKDDLSNENQTELEDEMINNGMPPPVIK